MLIGIILTSLAILVAVLAWYMPDQPDYRWTNEQNDKSKKKTINLASLNTNKILPFYKTDEQIINKNKCSKNERFILVLYDVDENGKYVEEIMGYADCLDEALWKRKELKRMSNIGSVIDIYTEQEYYSMKNAWNEIQQFE
jgi:hypothetical protein